MALGLWGAGFRLWQERLVLRAFGNHVKKRGLQVLLLLSILTQLILFPFLQRIICVVPLPGLNRALEQNLEVLSQKNAKTSAQSPRAAKALYDTILYHAILYYTVLQYCTKLRDMTLVNLEAHDVDPNRKTDKPSLKKMSLQLNQTSQTLF